MIRKKHSTGMIAVSLFVVIVAILSFDMLINTVRSQRLEYISGEEYAPREEEEFPGNFRSVDDKLVQYFKPQKNHLDHMKIRFAVAYAGWDTSGWQMRIRLLDKRDTVVKECITNHDEIPNWRYYTFQIDEDVKAGEMYSLEISQIAHDEGDSNWDLAYECFLAPQDLPENQYCVFNGEQLDKSIEVVYQYSWIDYSGAAKCASAAVALFILILGLIWYDKRHAVPRVFAMLLWAFSPVFIYVIAEMVTGNLLTISLEYCVKNLLIAYMLLLFCTAVFNRIWIGSSVFGLLIVFVALVQRWVLELRGRPLMLMDVLGYKTALTVFNSYTFAVSPVLFYAFLLFFLYLIIHAWCRGVCWKKSVCCYLLRIMLICVTAGGSIYVMEDATNAFNFWDVNSNYQKKGLLYALMSQIEYMYVLEPEGYSIEKTLSIMEENQNIPEKTIKPQNVFLIMNESFADLSQYAPIKAEVPILPFISKLSENTIKGWIYVPVFGAGTAESEYEVLTGNTKEFLAPGSTAYELYIGDKEYGLARQFHEQGFVTTALHPYTRENWNRDDVYPDMCFDEYISQENWLSPIEELRWMASDNTTYDKLIELDQKNDKGIFAFLVTMQNHGGYGEGSWYGYQPDVVLQYEQKYIEAETYLSLINESDRALQRLIAHYEESDEPTMIVMFGDHLPSIDKGFYRELGVKDEDEETDIERRMLRYRTPFLIWTNYPQESKEDVVLSTNFLGSYVMSEAGFELTPYQEFQLRFMESIPVISNGVICDADGEWYTLEEVPDKYHELIRQYEILQYNRVFDRKNTVDSVFSVLGEE